MFGGHGNGNIERVVVANACEWFMAYGLHKTLSKSPCCQSGRGYMVSERGFEEKRKTTQDV